MATTPADTDTPLKTLARMARNHTTQTGRRMRRTRSWNRGSERKGSKARSMQIDPARMAGPQDSVRRADPVGGDHRDLTARPVVDLQARGDPSVIGRPDQSHAVGDLVRGGVVSEKVDRERPEITGAAVEHEIEATLVVGSGRDRRRSQQLVGATRADLGLCRVRLEPGIGEAASPEDAVGGGRRTAVGV